MRIAVIVKNLTMGGMQRAAINLSETFAEEGHEAHLIYFKPKNKTLVPNDKVSLHLMDLEKIQKKTFQGAFLYLLPKIFNLFIRHSYFYWQGLVLHTIFRSELAKLEKASGPFDLIIMRGQGTFEMIWPYNDDRLILQQVNIIKEKKYFLHSFFLQKLFNHKQVVCNSPQVYSELASYFDRTRVVLRSLTMITSPINFEKIKLKADEYIPEFSHPYIVNVGRFSKPKNLSLLIDAFGVLKARYNVPHHLVLVGEGELKQEYLKQIDALGITGYVHFTGLLTNPYPWVKHADLFAFTSLHEGLPNVLLESLACHTMIVSTRGRGGTLDIMTNGLEKHLCDFDATEFAEKMEEVLSGRSNPFDFDKHLETYLPRNVVSEYLSLFT